MSGSERREPRPRHWSAAFARAGSPGFTLIEVLAAVAILGLSYTVLTRQGIEGLIWEGEADRMLRASLVADRFLSDLEVYHLLGTTPTVGHFEQTVDDFEVAMDVVPFELPPGLLPEPADAAGARPGGDPATVSGGVLAPGRGAPPPLRTVEVTVRWHDGRSERSLHRTTFVLDAAAVAPVLAAAGLGGEAPPAEGDTPSPAESGTP